MKIAEYRTASGDSFAALDKDVNKLLAQGYQLYGNPYIVENKAGGALGTFSVGQAMVKFAMHEKFPPAEPLPPGSLIAP